MIENTWGPSAKQITSNLQSSLYTAITHDTFTRYLAENIFEVPTLQFRNSIHWSIFSRARRGSTYAVRKFVTKWICGSMATGRVMFERQMRSHSRCPHCQEEDEHLIHILTCHNEAVKSIRAATLSRLSNFLTESQTDPSLKDFLCTGLHSFLEDPYGLEPTFTAPTNAHSIAFHTVQRFGWFSLLCGFVPKDITLVQQWHLHRLNSRRTPTAWGTKLIKHLWTILYELWILRNEALHNSTIDDYHGHTELRTAVVYEFSLGLNTLPQSYATFFSLPSVEELLRKSTIYLKN